MQAKGGRVGTLPGFLKATSARCVSFTRIYDEILDESVSQALSERHSIADLSTWAIEFMLEKGSEKGQKNTPTAKPPG
jgi:hypothetical protein